LLVSKQSYARVRGPKVKKIKTENLLQTVHSDTLKPKTCDLSSEIMTESCSSEVRQEDLFIARFAKGAGGAKDSFFPRSVRRGRMFCIGVVSPMENNEDE
jgi:hypothetical protein